MLKASDNKRLKLNYNTLFSNVAFNFNLRRYIGVESQNLRLLIEGEKAQRRAMESEADLSIAKAANDAKSQFLAGSSTRPLLSST